ncbi:unnamed protein product [Meloidogyne enterolobii]|uniref:Uncharacterized protein n=1 Tax=Meloidogyne enterolobii TaxID=390850 RepID=A0ACB1B8A6_MELEN
MFLGYTKGVHTFVDYWELEDKKTTRKTSRKIKTMTVKPIKHKYSDTIETSCTTNLEQLKTRYIHRVTLRGLSENKRYGTLFGEN